MDTLVQNPFPYQYPTSKHDSNRMTSVNSSHFFHPVRHLSHCLLQILQVLLSHPDFSQYVVHVVFHRLGGYNRIPDMLYLNFAVFQEFQCHP